MIVSSFNVVYENHGCYYGVFDDKDIMEDEYQKIKNSEDSNSECEFDLIIDDYKYKEVEVNQLFELDKQNFVLVYPKNTDKDYDFLLVFTESKDEYFEYIPLIKNKFNYSENFEFVKMEEFKKIYSKDLDKVELPTKNNNFTERYFKPQYPEMFQRFSGLDPKKAASKVLTNLLKNKRI